MKIKMSYFIKYEDGSSIWLAAGKEVPKEAVFSEERPMLFPEEGMMLRHKENKKFSAGHWLRNETINDWEEISDEEFKIAIKELEIESKDKTEKHTKEVTTSNK